MSEQETGSVFQGFGPKPEITGPVGQNFVSGHSPDTLYGKRSESSSTRASPSQFTVKTSYMRVVRVNANFTVKTAVSRRRRLLQTAKLTVNLALTRTSGAALECNGSVAGTQRRPVSELLRTQLEVF